MPRFRLAGAAAVAVALLPGCLTLYSKTEVVRGDEARRPVRFETPAASDRFYATMKFRHPSAGGTYLGVPFVTFYARTRTLSDNAAFNDAVARCDADQDGLITLAEAEAYARHGE